MSASLSNATFHPASLNGLTFNPTPTAPNTGSPAFAPRGLHPAQPPLPVEARKPAAAPAKKSCGSILKRAAWAALLLVAGLGAARFAREWWTVGRFIESTDDAYVSGDVTVIAPKVPGFIAQVAVGDNQEVRAGDLLVKLDDRDYRAALAKADAVVSMQQAGLTNLAATRYLQEALVEEAEASVASAEAEISRAHDDQARYQRLSVNAAVSVQSLQKAESDYKQAVASGGKARAGLAAARRQMAVIDAQQRQTLAALDQALAERDLARLNLGETELRAPIDGIVGNRGARAGAYAATGAQLISLVPARGLWIDANFKENQLSRMRPGQTALVKADVWPGRVLHAHVASLAPATGAQFSVLPPENATGNFTKIVQRVAVRILLDEEDTMPGRLLPGLSVTAEVDSRSLIAPARSAPAETRNQAAARADGRTSGKGVL